MAKIIQWGRFLGKKLANLGKKVLLDLAVSLATDVFPKLATEVNSSVLDSGKGVVRAGKEFTLFTSNEDMNDIMKIAESL